MNESKNSIEYAVDKKVEGKVLMLRILLILGYIAFSLFYFLFFTMGPVKIVMLIAFLPVFLWMLIFFTWRYTDITNEYTIISGGRFTFSQIFGNRSRKTVLETQVQDWSLIAPMSDPQYAAKAKENIDKIYDARSSESAPNGYFGIFKNESGQTCAVYFNATVKTLDILRWYNKTALIYNKDICPF